ncbi:MAG: PAC2 family protein [bacterium]
MGNTDQKKPRNRGNRLAKVGSSRVGPSTSKARKEADPAEDSVIRIDRRPDLHLPVLFAAWPGMGSVAVMVAQKLVEKLGLEPIGCLDSAAFTYSEGILIRNHIILPLQLPEYRFYAGRNPSGKGDLLVFIADNQPTHPQGFALARLVLKVANQFGVRRMYTAAALATSISHMETPRVWGVSTHRESLTELRGLSIELLAEGHVRGLNGLLLGVGKHMGFEGICLLGELPYYMVGMDNPKSSLAILEKLSLLWSLSMDLSDLREEALQKEMEIEDFIRRGEKDSRLEGIVRRSEEDFDNLQ